MNNACPGRQWRPTTTILRHCSTFSFAGALSSSSVIPNVSVFSTVATTNILQGAKDTSIQNTTSSLTAALPRDEGNRVPKTDGDEPTFVSIISSVCGTITILTIVIAVACVKYDRWKRSRVIESKQSPDINIPMNENYNPEYEEIGDVDNNPQGGNRTATTRPNNQSTREAYQSLQVCRESPYLRIDERPALNDQVFFEETNTNNYDQMARSQIGNQGDAYQSLGDGRTGGEINEVPQIIDISNYEQLSRHHIAEESYQELTNVHSVNSRNEVQLQPSVESNLCNNDPTYCNTTI